jgi:hypothetical protein
MKLSISSGLIVLVGILVLGVQQVSRAEDAGASKPASQHKEAKSGNQPDRQAAWWSDRDFAWIGAIGGSTIGILGGAIGTLGGMGLARRFVLSLTAVLAGLGVVSLMAGVVALFVHQPYAVYYPLLLGGAVLSVVCGVNFPVLRHAYAQRELRKMAAMDSR